MPLTAAEAEAVRRYRDVIFGKTNASQNLCDDDPFDLYEWSLKLHAKMTQEQVVEFFERNSSVACYKR